VHRILVEEPLEKWLLGTAGNIKMIIVKCEDVNSTNKSLFPVAGFGMNGTEPLNGII
jgi:hypothetical protein